MKKILLTLIFLLSVAQQSQAVLKEKDLGHTLHVLRLELYNKWTRQKARMKQLNERSKTQHDQLVNISKRCEITSLILYSQGQDFTFDVAYACQEATSLYQEFQKSAIPFDQIKQNIEYEIINYDSLIYSLKQIPPIILDTDENADGEQNGTDNAGWATPPTEENSTFTLNAQGIKDRAMCIEYAETLRENMKVILKRLEKENKHYSNLFLRIDKLNDFAQKKYTDLQQSIFINPGTNYLQILSSIPRQWERMKEDIRTKYKPLEERGSNGQFKEYKSEWRGGIVLFASIFMLLYILGGTILSNVILRWLVPKRFRTEKFRQKRNTLIIALAVFLFAIAVMIVRTVIRHNLMLMATDLMIEMAWLIEAIYVSLIIRLKGEELKDGTKVYAPFILMSMIVICFRIILIPNTLVCIIFPPILFAFTIWQAITLKKCWKTIPTSDAIYCSISLFTMLASCILSWVGFTLMGVQIIVWWTFQLAAIATITSCYDLMEMYEDGPLCRRIKRAYGDAVKEDEIRFKMKRGDFVDQTWVYDFINRAFIPVCAVFSIIICIYMAAAIFNLRQLCITWFLEEIHVDRLFTASFFKISIVAALFFIFRYINYLVRSAWFRYRRKKKNKEFNATLARNIIALLIWGIYIITVFLMLHVPGTGIAIVTGGLSTGMGFASKSLLENFFYGISLMSGRVRVGDYIECDGMIGKVESITYQSTQITTLDGSVVAILNSDLFSKNFKNLTRNHQYERISIPFGVSYGTNVEEVRHMIIEGIKTLCKKTPDGRDIVTPKHPILVAFSDFGSSSVDLLLVAWVLVDQRISFTAQAKEKIYQVLNENNIEIPFPQQDIYIRSITKSEQNGL